MFFILLLAIILGIWLFNRQAPSDEDALEVDVASVDESTLMEQPATVQQPDVAKVDEPPAEVKASTSESQVSDVVKPLEKPTVVIPNAEAAKVTEKPAADKLAAEKQPSEKASPVKPVIEPAKIDAMKKVAVGSSLLRVKIVFTESAWVSVKDKSDNIVYEKLARAGDEDYADGTPPLKFHVGNVSGTRLIYNGESVDLNAYAHANVARITLGGN
jgi:cytoskeleton protein RodZ